MDANATIKALVRLIDDPDELVYQQVRDELMKFGSDVLPVLEQSWEQDYYGLLFQDRIENLIHDIQFETVKNQLNAWLYSSDKDLLTGAIIIAKYQFPGLDEAQLNERIQAIRRDIWLELNDHQTAFEQVKIFNRIFFGMHRFRGDGQNYHTPNNSYINTVLETRKGNPLSLCIIYSVIAQSLDLPIYGVNLPNHFVLAYMDSKHSSFGLQQEDDYGVLFYINAFAKGSIFDSREIKAFLDGIHLQPDRSHFEPCSNSAILKRMLSNLIYAFQQVGSAQKVAELQELRSLIP
ncbi:MAG: transglutaminase-like domain-containing protein [Flavobacteriales bacterium]